MERTRISERMAEFEFDAIVTRSIDDVTICVARVRYEFSMGQPDLTEVAISRRFINLEGRVECATMNHVKKAGELAETVQRTLRITEEGLGRIHGPRAITTFAA